jgi:hypothetical protein
MLGVSLSELGCLLVEPRLSSCRPRFCGGYR